MTANIIKLQTLFDLPGIHTFIGIDKSSDLKFKIV